VGFRQADGGESPDRERPVLFCGCDNQKILSARMVFDVLFRFSTGGFCLGRRAGLCPAPVFEFQKKFLVQVSLNEFARRVADAVVADLQRDGWGRAGRGYARYGEEKMRRVRSLADWGLGGRSRRTRGRRLPCESPV
jgi:hypothetical protein